MTTGESTDNMENVTITSDEAFERVTSDEHFEEEKDGGFLKQNTSGLVQEIPNISFLDVADTLLENKKTLHNRKNWNIVIGTAGKSIEAQPQDLARLVSNEYIHTGTTNSYVIPFNDIEIPSGEDETNIKTFSFENNGVKILIPGVYRISYGWQIYPGNTISFDVGLSRNGVYVTSDSYENVSLGSSGWGLVSGGRSISLNCEVNDVLTLYVSSLGDNPDVYLNNGDSRFTYLEVQYIQQVL